MPQSPVCGVFELHYLAQHVSQVRHLHFLSLLGLFLLQNPDEVPVPPGTKSGPGASAVGTGRPGGRAPPSPFRFTQNTFWNHHVTTRHQAIMEKRTITFKHNSRSKFSPFFCEIAGHQLLYINVRQ